jgi:uncharacterized membrane protein YhaH (DUF805 family)
VIVGSGTRCLTGARRLWNESFFSAPQLKRDPLGTVHYPMTFKDILVASWLWPWLLPSALLLAVGVGYFTTRSERLFYLAAAGLWIATSVILYWSDPPPRTAVNVLVSCLVTAVYFPVSFAAFLARRLHSRPLPAACVAFLVGVACIPFAGILALLSGCALSGDCI